MPEPVINTVCKVPVLKQWKRSGGTRRKHPQKHDPSIEYQLRYRSKKHSALPHVVKFSGGRSSALMLFTLLENGLLDASRGDVIIFNNTSAEHPYTYKFVRDCVLASHKYGVPFFLVEFQTYEDVRHREWTRLPTYRLVNDLPKTAVNEDGFHWRGEVYEELLSWTGYIPNQFQRTCTKHLKIDVTRDFLKDWLASKPAISRLGHFGKSSRIDPDRAYQQHQRNNGNVPKSILLRKRAYTWGRPHFRPEQHYQDYCSYWQPFENEIIQEKIFGGKAWFGNGGMEYVALIGLRGDEQQRILRVEARNETPSGHEGEHVYMPLNDMAVTRDDVNAFWALQSWDLDFPKDTGMSNCVYCFLKGVANLSTIHAELGNSSTTEIAGFGQLAESPSDLKWWIEMENKYSRDLQAENRKTRSDKTHIGFFGNHRFAFQDLDTSEDLDGFKESILPCDCTE